MIKIKLWSDLHLERTNYNYDHIWEPSPDDADTILMLAGDIGVGTACQAFFTEMCSNFKHVLFVCGNHEYYHGDFFQVNAAWHEFEEAAPVNFHFLNNDWRVIDGVRFLGGTMWTSLNNADIFSMLAAQRELSDYEEILCNKKLIKPEFVIHQHGEFIKFLTAELDKPFDGPTVVMTHHSPGNKLRRTGRAGDLLGAAYFADIEDIVGGYDIALWVHGHTHQSYDYMVNETNVVCNPFGYVGDVTNKNFDDNYTLVVTN